jgi:hypothetical protein
VDFSLISSDVSEQLKELIRERMIAINDYVNIDLYVCGVLVASLENEGSECAVDGFLLNKNIV